MIQSRTYHLKYKSISIGGVAILQPKTAKTNPPSFYT